MYTLRLALLDMLFQTTAEPSVQGTIEPNTGQTAQAGIQNSSYY